MLFNWLNIWLLCRLILFEYLSVPSLTVKQLVLLFKKPSFAY